MSLNSAISAAYSGLQANQASLGLVSANIANANTPGYTRKTLNQIAVRFRPATCSKTKASAGL